MKESRPSRFPLDFVFIALIWVVWVTITSLGDRWFLFIDSWFMSVTMAFGSFVAGSTSQGGGAVAFPVMTLGFDIDPKGARDFSMMIQSVGMTSASVAILWRRIRIEKVALIVAGCSGALGIIFGLEIVQFWFSSTPTKVFFVSLWLAFGVALWTINRVTDQVKREELADRNPGTLLALALAGFVGGSVSGLLGSGLDIFVFAVLVLGFRVCETVATPTSVMLMASNSLVGFLWRLAGGGGDSITPEIWNYWWVCVPIVAIGAPLGARFISNRGHLFVVRLLLVVIVAQFAGALLILKFDRLLTGLAVATFGLGVTLFLLFWKWGKRYA
ncbi:MAG: sulfite exporter TauE/SafE family protein [Verrucomicrobiota bacterium]